MAGLLPAIFTRGKGDGSGRTRVMPQPLRHILGIPIRREDRIEDVRDPAIVDDEGEPLEQDLPLHGEGWQPQSLREHKPLVR